MPEPTPPTEEDGGVLAIEGGLTVEWWIDHPQQLGMVLREHERCLHRIAELQTMLHDAEAKHALGVAKNNRLREALKVAHVALLNRGKANSTIADERYVWEALAEVANTRATAALKGRSDG